MALFLLHEMMSLTCRKTTSVRVVGTAWCHSALHTCLKSHSKPTLVGPSKLVINSLHSCKNLHPGEFSGYQRQNISLFCTHSSNIRSADSVTELEKTALNENTVQNETDSSNSSHLEDENIVSDVYSPPQLNKHLAFGSSLNNSVSNDLNSSSDNKVHIEQTSLTLGNSTSVYGTQTDPTSSLITPEEGDSEKLPARRTVQPSYNLAPYVAQSAVLQNLVSLGVDLSAMEKVKEVADVLVQADWYADIQPRLLFLRDIGVPDSVLGKTLNKNPLILKESIEKMQVVVSYLESKKFSQEQLLRIVTSAPLTLVLPATYVDKKLGYLQKTFHLTGDEVRHVATKHPKIIPWKLQKLKDIRFYMKEMLGFSDKELKAMLVATPRVYLSNKEQLGSKFDFLHNVMGLSHQHLCAWSTVFRARLHILKQRHRFLLLMGRAQYDPTKENYVSLHALVSKKDGDFCSDVAKATTTQFYDFLKTL